MTTILGLRSGGVTYLAADSRICCGNPLPVTVQKIIECGRWAIAAAGDAKIYNLIDEASLDIAECPGPAAVCAHLRQVIEADGWQKKTGEVGSPAWANITLFLADSSNLWHIGCDLGWTAVDDERIIGAGSGHEYALGAFVSLGREVPIEEALRKAIVTASSFDPATDDRVQIVRRETARVRALK